MEAIKARNAPIREICLYSIRSSPQTCLGLKNSFFFRSDFSAGLRWLDELRPAEDLTSPAWPRLTSSPSSCDNREHCDFSPCDSEPAHPVKPQPATNYCK